MHEICRVLQALPFSSRKVENKILFERPVHLLLCGTFGTIPSWRGHSVSPTDYINLVEFIFTKLVLITRSY